MKRLGWGVLSILCLLSGSVSASALTTIPSSNTVLINGPLIITGYSIAGDTLRYVQIFNNSNDIVDLTNWRVSSEKSASSTVHAELTGILAPNSYATIASAEVLPSATFIFSNKNIPLDPVLSSISLLPPLGTNLKNETVAPTISPSTPRVSGTPSTYYFARNISSTTGSYLSTYTAFVPTVDFAVVSDNLYAAPDSSDITIVEIYPNATTCSPFTVSNLCNDYVKILNHTPHDVDLSQYRIRTGSSGQSATSSNTAKLNGSIVSNQYVIVPIVLSASGSWVWVEDEYGVTSYESSLVQYPSSSGYDQHAWSYDEALSEWKWTRYPTPANEPNKFDVRPTVNECTGLILSEITANADSADQYIEIYNPTIESINLAGCLLQTNRSTTKSFQFEDEVLTAGGFRTVYVKDTELILTKTTRGTVYLFSSDHSNVIDSVTYEDLAENTSLALIDGQWKQTYQQTPGTANVWIESKPCEIGSIRNISSGLCNQRTLPAAGGTDCGPGKIRNPETNRCRSIENLAATLAQCSANQYRSAETNRCRSMTSSASLLAPCASNQERNPNTSRCRSIAASIEQKPCAQNQERNPDTNRCKNKTTEIAADFPIEDVAQAAEATLGWWAFGGAGILATGYAGWEWRREVSNWIKKMLPFGITRP